MSDDETSLSTTSASSAGASSSSTAGGSGGTTASTAMTSTVGTGGAVTTGATGGGDASAQGGAGGGSSVDASLESDVSAADARVADARAEGDGNPGGDTLPGKPWIHLCPKTATHEECCAFLCSCLVTNCSDSPQDRSGIDNCMTKCPTLTDMMLRCHVYHCYESLNPGVPQDHDSHCGHASGRVAGGTCPPAVYQ
jgi:hypothetical protein